SSDLTADVLPAEPGQLGPRHGGCSRDDASTGTALRPAEQVLQRRWNRRFARGPLTGRAGSTTTAPPAAEHSLLRRWEALLIRVRPIREPTWCACACLRP